MFIQTEQTPNPQTLKFLPGRVVMKEGTAFFQNIGEAVDSPLAKRLFNLDGVTGVFFGSDFITITKPEDLDWQVIKPAILGAIMDHFNSEEPTINKEVSNKGSESLKTDEGDSDIVKQIKELLDTRVRPAVAMDGGDIVYKKFEDLIGEIPTLQKPQKNSITVCTYELGGNVAQGQMRTLNQVRTIRFLLEDFANSFISGQNLPDGLELDNAVKNAIGLS